MYVKMLRRKCGVRGCKNTNTFALSLTRENGNSVIICKSCLGKALGAIDEVPNAPMRKSNGIPPLFFNKGAGVDASPVEELEATSALTVEKESGKANAAEGTEKSEQNVGDSLGGAESGDETKVSESQNKTEENAFECEKCGRAFSSERGLNLHLKSCKATEVSEGTA